jgi:hypothetical protein
MKSNFAASPGNSHGVRSLLLLTVLAGCGGTHAHDEPQVRDSRTLGVEVRGGGDHAAALRDGAAAGLARVKFVQTVSARGEVELQLDVQRLEVVGRRTMCKVKVLVLRLPAHVLLGMAEGTAWAGGTDDTAARDCAATLGAALVSRRLRPLLRRELSARR